MSYSGTQPLPSPDGFGETVKFYSDRHPDLAKRTGLSVQYVTSRNGHTTLNIELAKILSGGAAPDWENKIVIQLTQAELAGLCCVLFGLKQKVEGSYHGDNRNKGFAAYHNGPDGAAITVSEKGVQLHHMLKPGDRLELSVFVVRRLSESWKITPADTIAILRQSILMERGAGRS